jgi:hypothetical protein
MNRERVALELIKTAKKLLSFYDDDYVELVTEAHKPDERRFFMRAPKAIGYDWGTLQGGNEKDTLAQEKKKAVKILYKAAQEYARIVDDEFYGAGRATISKWSTGLGVTVKLPKTIREHHSYKDGYIPSHGKNWFAKKIKSVMKKYGVTIKDENYLGEFN